MKQHQILITLIVFLTVIFGGCSVNPQDDQNKELNDLTRNFHLTSDWHYRSSQGVQKEFAAADFDDSLWESVNFPTSGFNFDFSGGHHFWFRKTFKVAESLDGHSMGIVMGVPPSAIEVYLNGSLVGIYGQQPPENEYFANPNIPCNFILPSDLIVFGGENVLAFHVYTMIKAEDFSAPYITSVEKSVSGGFIDYLINSIIPMLICFGSLFSAAFFFFIYLRDKTEVFNLYAALGHILITLYLSIFFVEMLPLPLIWAYKIWYLAMFWGMTFFTFFFQDFFDAYRNRIYRYVILGVVSLCSIIMIFMGDLTGLLSLIRGIFYLTVFAPLLFFALAISFKAVRQKMKYGGLLFTGVAVLIGTGIHDLIYGMMGLTPLIWLSNIGMGFYILTIFLTAANRTVDRKIEVFNLNQQLTRANIELNKQKTSFYRFVPTQFLNLLGRESIVDVELGDNSQRTMSILFSDIRKFTTISETMSPKENFTFLNSYLHRMENAIQKNDGFVDKYIGDAIMSLFSDEESYETTSAVKAVTSGVDMIRELKSYNMEIIREGVAPLNIGVGINTGDLMLGTVGSSNRLDTTVIGDAVNLASRLESLTKFYRSDIIISESTYLGIPEKDRTYIRELDWVTVKGRSKPVVIYEIFQTNSPGIKEAKKSYLDKYREALSLYKEQNFDDALSVFLAIRKDTENLDNIATMYAKRCLLYKKKPPSDNWDGVFKHSIK